MIDRRWGALFWFKDEETARNGRIDDHDERVVIEGAQVGNAVLPIALETAEVGQQDLLDLAYKRGAAAALAQVRQIRDVNRGYYGVLNSIAHDLGLDL